ncbi:MAG: TIGR04013 family B12-binding domain/radical SAM domain-containing protein [Calditerrivibrio sp.]|nr:TIGR04013 family B12-binding domain/radical SAM domain-containing protein [Calditerrivibrio sp.]
MKCEHFFVLDKYNKFSIRALLVAFEKWFPDLNYRVIKVDEIKDHLTDGFYFFSFNSINARFYLELVNSIKKSSRNLKTVCGGPHPSARPDEVSAYFDKVGVGEGELILKEIVEDLLSGNEGKKVYKSSSRISLDDYPAYPRKKSLFGAIELMRGCTFSCSYCQTPQLYKGALRFRSVEKVLEDVAYGLEHNKTDIRFISPDSASYFYNGAVNYVKIEDLLNRLSKLLKGRGRIFYGSFPSEINPYFVNDDFVRLIKEYCHNRRVVLGLQSASKKMLKKMNRPDDIERVEYAIELFLKYRFIVDVDFIFGLPFETDETIMETMQWIEKWSSRVRIHSHYFMPLPGSKWEHLSPTEMPEYFERFVKSLEGKSRLFGQWNTQQNLAYCLESLQV